MPSSRMREQSNKAGTRGSADFAPMLRFSCAWAREVPKPNTANARPPRTNDRPIKTRRLKKADCDDFFFILDSPSIRCPLALEQDRRPPLYLIRILFVEIFQLVATLHFRKVRRRKTAL